MRNLDQDVPHVGPFMSALTLISERSATRRTDWAWLCKREVLASNLPLQVGPWSASEITGAFFLFRLASSPSKRRFWIRLTMPLK
jgi:hypothetical protein